MRMIHSIKRKNKQFRKLSGLILLFITLSSATQCNQKKESEKNSSLLALTGGAVVQIEKALNPKGTTFRESDAAGNLKSENNQTEPSDGHTAIILKGDAQMAGGGLLVYIREMDSGITVPVVIENNVPRFATVGGKRYMANLDFYIDGINNTEIDGQMLNVPFTATEIDKVSFYVTSQKVGLYVNGNSHESNMVYDPAGNNARGNNAQERAAWRRENYLLTGGDGFVLEYVYKNN